MTAVGDRRTPLGAGVRAALPGWVTARLLVLAAAGVAAYLGSRYQGVEPRLAAGPPGPFGWDAGWYEAIATNGYAAIDREALRFFPLLPLLGWAVGLVVGSERLGLLVVVNAAALAAGALVHRLAVLEKGDEALAERAAWLLALFPVAFVLAIPYAESLAIALGAAALLGGRTLRWGGAAAAGLLVGLARPLGALLALPLAIEALRTWSSSEGRRRLVAMCATVSPVAGTLAYLAWVGVRFGDPLLPVRVQQRANLRGGLAAPSSTFPEAVRSLTSGEGASAALHLVWFAVFALLLVVAFRRWPVSYGALAAATLAATVSFNSLDSLERYGLSAFPFVLAAASVVPGRWERPVLALAAGGLSTYALLAFLGPYVP